MQIRKVHKNLLHVVMAESNFKEILNRKSFNKPSVSQEIISNHIHMVTIIT